MPSSTSSSDSSARAWRRFATVLIATGAGGVLVLWLFVVLVDPFGRLPISLPFDRGPVDSNARYAFPLLARDQQFDGAIFGNSTARLLRPVTLDPVLDARIANLSMNAATPYEQSRLLEVFLAAHPAPRVVLFGVDTQWCEISTNRRFTDRPFPEWLYSGSPWAGYREMADLYSLEKAGQAFAEWTGLKKRVYGRDGYTRFVPDDSRYDPVRVAELMRDAVPYSARPGMIGPAAGWAMPNADLMRGAIAAIPPATRVLLFVVPVNHRMIPRPDTPEAALLAECKRRIAAIAAARAGGMLIDFMIDSPITSHDENYWDPWHYRVGIAERIAGDIGAAMRAVPSEDYVVRADAIMP
jgi:hypothetical protein